MAFRGKFCNFCKLIMPKLLSRSKHEEFESKSSLQIRSQKERRAKSEEKWSTYEIGSFSTVHFSCTVHHFATVPSCCMFDALAICYDFCFFPFGIFTCLGGYISQLYTLFQETFFAVNKITAPVLPFFFFSFIFFPLSRLPNTLQG